MLNFDEGAERITIAAMLADPMCIRQVKVIVGPDDFHLQHHKWIAEAIYAQGFRSDAYSVGRYLEERGWLTQVPGGQGYISDLQREVVTSQAVERHASAVAAERKRRDLMQRLTDIAKLANDKTRDIDDSIRTAAAKLADIAHESLNDDLPMNQVAATVMADFEARADGRYKPDGVMCGVPMVDTNVIPEAGNLITVAGRPGSGKSVLMGQYALSTAKRGHRVEWFSYEMGQKQVYRRAAQSLSGVGWAVNGESKLSADQRTKFKQGCAELLKLPISIDTETQNIAHVIAKCEAMADKGVKLIIIDYVQIATVDDALLGNKQSVTRDREIAAATGALKRLARRLGVIVIIGSQLSRAADGVPPTLAAMRESGGIENDSDIVLGLHTPFNDGTGKVETNIREVHVLKNREGDPSGVYSVYFDGACKRMLPLIRERIEL